MTELLLRDAYLRACVESAHGKQSPLWDLLIELEKLCIGSKIMSETKQNIVQNPAKADYVELANSIIPILETIVSFPCLPLGKPETMSNWAKIIGSVILLTGAAVVAGGSTTVMLPVVMKTAPAALRMAPVVVKSTPFVAAPALKAASIALQAFTAVKGIWEWLSSKPTKVRNKYKIFSEQNNHQQL